MRLRTAADGVPLETDGSPDPMGSLSSSTTGRSMLLPFVLLSLLLHAGVFFALSSYQPVREKPDQVWRVSLVEPPPAASVSPAPAPVPVPVPDLSPAADSPAPAPPKIASPPEIDRPVEHVAPPEDLGSNRRPGQQVPARPDAPAAPSSPPSAQPQPTEPPAPSDATALSDDVLLEPVPPEPVPPVKVRNNRPSLPGLRQLLDQEVIVGQVRHPAPQSDDRPSRTGITFDTRQFMYQGYMASLKDKVEGAWKYPLQARRDGIQGDLMIRFVVRQDGTLGEVKVIRTSGHSLLDRAAVQALRDGEPYWPLPKDWDQQSLEVTGRFIYLLDDVYIR